MYIAGTIFFFLVVLKWKLLLLLLLLWKSVKERVALVVGSIIFIVRPLSG